ncbi:MAG: hypothetical protein KKE42_04940 [Alphaproteobacteria bacterium]|uniref:hypothetical protein n=1 Tax=Brevundimonas sp. TaxID=1871086 RepID=UPI00179F414A|nr:hypothetical protein [Brevundimonas sp.]MBU3971375.1 hypothetical protein [Alphaproteobacteria bacterium]MBA3048765.1 hypothetical protein [Brevundimonas sp.]MBU3973130.1 hypothetical protein [Alphaproteobacteria bacterium]MBU4038766.1 hypothetical protein [Alphaproteobacteria bacterium]MBU4134845.1 hypothetical protein [Alphaproteobacteria bacterium]
MTDTMKGATPWHLWAAGVISLLWNAFGGYDFVMSVTQGETYWRASGMTDAMVAYYNAMPTWMYVPWVLGVWGAVAGSVLLLMRNKLAVPAFGLSLLGAVGSLAYGLANPMPPLPEAMAMMSYMPWVIVLIAAVLAAYAWTMGKKGVLS